MIEKMRSIQDSWLIKLILVLTGLSFVSLFGVSGYYAAAGRNKTVIKVGSLEVSQAEVANQVNEEIQKARKLFGDNLDVNDNIREVITQGVIQKMVSNMILTQTALDNNVYISDALIKKIIASQPEFMDQNGKFCSTQMRRILSSVGMSERQYIESLRDDIERLHLVYNMVDGINVPEFMAKYKNQIDNQKKVFQYVLVAPEKMKIDRKISQDEIEQYYNDFAAQFVAPEARDVSFIKISNAEAADKVIVSDEDVKFYYDENIKQFVVPETRNILQMVFDSKEKADEAYAKLKNGADFYAVAKSLAAQDKTETELGFVEKDMLIGDMGDIMFSLKNGEISQPVQSDYGWHIMKVTAIKPMQKTEFAQAKKKIVEILKQEQMDVAAGDLIAKIEDEIGAGKNLKDIAKLLSTPVFDVKDLKEDGSAEVVDAKMKKLVSSSDFIDTAFSYNVGEVSQALETDDGFVFVQVNKITEPRQKSVDEVVPQITKLWEINEKNAIAQEVIADVVHDVENGDNLENVARRFSLPFKTSKAIKKSESFEELSTLQIQELFAEKMNQPKVLDNAQNSFVVVPVKVINASTKLSQDELNAAKQKAQVQKTQEMAQQLIQDYGSNYKIKIKYKDLGFMD